MIVKKNKKIYGLSNQVKILIKAMEFKFSKIYRKLQKWSKIQDKHPIQVNNAHISSNATLCRFYIIKENLILGAMCLLLPSKEYTKGIGMKKGIFEPVPNNSL
jgi:hypothetical protein